LSEILWEHDEQALLEINDELHFKALLDWPGLMDPLIEHLLVGRPNSLPLIVAWLILQVMVLHHEVEDFNLASLPVPCVPPLVVTLPSVKFPQYYIYYSRETYFQ
jgi:hypothetical protein